MKNFILKINRALAAKKKFTTFLFALLISVSVFAQNSGACGRNLVWSYDSLTHELSITGKGDMYNFVYFEQVPWYQYRKDITSVSFDNTYIPGIPEVEATEGAVTLVWNIANIDNMCNDIQYVFAGNYNNWETSDPSDLVHFEPIPGYEGWFKAVIVLQNGDNHLEGKPCALGKDGTFPSSWDYQWINTENHPCEVLYGDAYTILEYSVESRLVCEETADVVYIRSYAFKNDPCYEPVYDDVTFNLTVTVPVNAGDTVFIVGDAFEQKWDQTAYPMQGSGSNWTITLPALIGKSYMFCVNANWDNEQMAYNAEKNCVERAQNMMVDWVTMNSTIYGFLNAGLTDDQICREHPIEGVMYIGCASNGWNWEQMIVDPNDNNTFYYETIVADASLIGANISFTASNEYAIWYWIENNNFAQGDDIRYTFVSSNGGSEGVLTVSPISGAPARKIKKDVNIGITSIGNYAFYGCSNLDSITIPSTVTSIGYFAFSYNNLSSLSVDSGNAMYDSRNNCNAIIETSTNKLVVGCKNTVIPNSVTTIGSYAFYGCTGLLSVTIPNSVTNIGDGAFYGCTGLTSIEISINVQYDGYENMFQSCLELREIIAPACFFDTSNEDISKRQAYFPHNLDSIVVTGGQLTDNALWFINLSRKTLKSIDLSATVHTDLPDEAFKEFYNLTSIQLPANLTHISYKMLAECVKLKSIDIPASVTEIDDRALEDCRSLETITFGGLQPSTAPGRQSAAAIGSQLRRIGNWAFYNAHELQHLQIPEGVTEIGDGAFYGCTYMEDLALPSSVQSIGDNCFALCSKLKRIVVNSTTPPTIRTKTFYDVKRQIPVYVPDDCVAAYEDDELWGEFDIQGISNAPTGLETTNGQMRKCESTKILRDGQIYILRDDKTYTVIGQEVK